MFSIINTTDSVFRDLRFVQSQMWTVDVIKANNILLEDIYVNNTSQNSLCSTQNTDGSNTLYSNNITYSRWSITNGDDSIAMKANSSNIIIKDSIFRAGDGIAIGSVGQYAGHYEFVENVTATNITLVGTQWAGYIKTWTGVQEGYPPNGGGGGLGHAKNIVWEDFSLEQVRGVLDISQCTSYSGYTGNCDTSLFLIEDVVWKNMTGTAVDGVTDAADLQCSGAAPCQNITIEGISVVQANGSAVTDYECTNVESQVGFTCTGDDV